MKSNHITLISTFFFCLALPHWISATYGGSFYSYTATNHDVPRVFPLVYKSPVYSYQYAALPSATHTSFQTFPSVATPAVVPYQAAVWPATTYTTAFTKPTLPVKPVTFQDSVFTAPCAHGAHGQVNSLFEIVRPTSYAPVKVKPNNTTEHVYKSVFTPIYSPFWTSYQPLFSYQGTIQHVPPPPPIDKTGSSEMMEKEDETPKEEATKPKEAEGATKKTEEAAKISEKEEAEAAASNKEPTTSSTTEAPAKEESSSIAEETEKNAMKKAKARRDLFSSKRFNGKKRL